MLKNDVQSDLMLKIGYFSVAAGVVVFVSMLLLTFIHP